MTCDYIIDRDDYVVCGAAATNTLHSPGWADTYACCDEHLAPFLRDRKAIVTARRITTEMEAD